ncbi:MAG: hypothetical protein U0V75_06500 [Ferruginibacter sp.]
MKTSAPAYTQYKQMRTLKFLAGLGTILLFIAFYCFKAALKKESVPLHGSSTGKEKKKPWLPLVLGIISAALGILSFILLIRQL